MKRELYNNVKLIPGGTAVAIDRSGFLSAIVAASVTTAADGSVTTAADGQKVAFSVTHCDTQNGKFVAVDDDHIGIDGPLREAAVKTGDMLNVDIDLLGCKQYIKITPTTEATVVYAVVLGDPAQAPV